jgi:hypothetical protein
MAKIELKVADNVSLKREDRIYRAGETFSTAHDDEIDRWIALGYVEEIKTRRKKVTRKK